MVTVLDRLFGVFSTDMGIDLGTCNTLVCVKGEGIVLSEPSVVAVRRGTNKVLLDGQAVGHAAKQMLGKTPGAIEAIRPLKDGVIADFEITEQMIKYFIQKVHNRKRWMRPRVVIAHPSGITAVEKRAVIQSAERAGARKVILVPEPIAAALGVGLPIEEPLGSMITDIGGGTAEVAVLSLVGVVSSVSVRVAGDEMDQSIMKHMKETYNLLIGEQTAERIKINIGSAYPLEREMSMEVKGRDLVTAMPRKVVVTSEEVRESLRVPISQIIRAIRETLEKTPPELSADLVEEGLCLAGGGSLIRGVDKAIHKEIEIPVRVAEDPLTAVARGCGVILENLDQLKEILECGEDLL